MAVDTVEVASRSRAGEPETLSVPRARLMRARAGALRELAADQPRVVADAFERRARQLEAGARLMDVIMTVDRSAIASSAAAPRASSPPAA